MAAPIDVRSLDFSALGSKTLPASPGTVYSRFPGLPTALGIGTAGLALLTIGIIAVGLLTGQVRLDPGAGPIVSAVVGVLLLLGFAALGLWRAATALRARRAPVPDPDRFERFAEANGLSYAERDYFPDFAGTSLADARATLLGHVRPAEGDDFAYGTVTFPRGQGFLEERSWGFLVVRLDRAMPHLVLTTILRRLPQRDEFDRVALPPRFEHGFDLRCAPGGESGARALFRTPLLTLLSAQGGDLDVEVVGDRFFAYGSPFDLDDPAVHRRLLRITNLVGERVRISGGSE